VFWLIVCGWTGEWPYLVSLGRSITDWQGTGALSAHPRVVSWAFDIYGLSWRVAFYRGGPVDLGIFSDNGLAITLLAGILFMFIEFLKSRGGPLLAYESERMEEVDIGDRVAFKIAAARYHLRHLKELSEKKSMMAGEGRLEAEILIEAYVTAVLAASEGIEVEIKRKTRSARARDLEKKLMMPIEIARRRGGWLWRVQQLRNVSAHTEYIAKHLAVTLPQGPSGMRLPKDPTNPKLGPYHLELIPDCEEMMRQRLELTSQLRSQLTKELAKTAPKPESHLVDLVAYSTLSQETCECRVVAPTRRKVPPLFVPVFVGL